MIKYILKVFNIPCTRYRGDFFRREFSKLGEVRSLIPSSINMMALTATATVKSRDKIMAILGMSMPVIISESPDKPNLIYRVQGKTTIDDVFTPLVHRLRNERGKMARVIVFCQKCEDCAALYEFFLSSLKEEFTEPVGAPNLARFRLVDMYMSATHNSVKESIVKSFCECNNHLRVVICTIAFGMGVDTVGVRQVIHWGVASDVESYVQESGRAGRDGDVACATIFCKGSDLDKRRVSKEMITYCQNKTHCRRTILFVNFDSTRSSGQKNPIGCLCCDVCALSCQCSDCKCSFFPI